MSNAAVPLKVRGWGQTSRRDAWWVQPLVVFLALGAFLAYANVRVFEGRYYYATQGGANYLTPFYSPLLFNPPGQPPCPHAWWSERPWLLAWMPGWVTPAALILIFPAGFRFTCYYYRGAYYKAFWADPPSCAVGEPRKMYWGENSLPLILQNLHRYFLLFAVIFLVILAWDVWHALWFKDAAGGWRFGVGMGTLVLAVNLALLTGYTFGCHSMRHLMGGGRDHVSQAPLGPGFYNCVSCLNRKHMLWAWMSLCSVAFADVYVRMVSAGVWTDLRLL